METTNKKKFYVTTPIYYVTAQPHLGSLYSTLLADVAARWHKLRGFSTFFLTGTDEHGQKIAEAASKAHKEPKEFVDGFIEAYKEVWHAYDIQYDHFIRTTDTYHVKAVQQWIRDLIASGDIYKSFYTGYYCTPCETYVTEKEESTGVCPSCSRATIFISEESYFFRLSAYQERLLKLYEEHPDFVIPNERLAEVLSFVKSGLKDLSISRTTLTWGIPFPDDTKHITYVWADALNNYITAVGYGNPARKEEFAYWWPADLQVMGKDIIRFHAVYWPAFLMASGLAVPKHLLVHGWLKVNNQKMSKSLGNVVDPKALLSTYGADAVRYYLIRHMAITQDAEFSTLDLEQRLTADLANDLGNLVQRAVTLVHKRNLIEIKAPALWSAKEVELRDACWSMIEACSSDMHDGYYYRALQHVWKYIHEVNAYFHASEPWKVTDESRFEEIISATLHSVHTVALLLWPVMPTKMESLLASLGTPFALAHDMPGQDIPAHDIIEQLTEHPWKRSFMVHKTAPLFEKYEAVQPTDLQPTEPQSAGLQLAVGPTIPTITIDDFAKVALVVGTIEQCEPVAGSDKLLKLNVNMGPHGQRLILSGVKKSLLPEDLIGKQAVFVLNLAPRKMMGMESHGMMLTAQDSEKNLKIVTPTVPVPNGTRLS